MTTKNELLKKLEKTLKHEQTKLKEAKIDLILAKKEGAEAQKKLNQSINRLNNYLEIDLGVIENNLIGEAYQILEI